MKKGMLGALLGVFATQASPVTEEFADRHLSTPRGNKRVKKPDHQLEIERKTRQGLKQFEVDGKLIWALNMKNAIRKADKL